MKITDFRFVRWSARRCDSSGGTRTCDQPPVSDRLFSSVVLHVHERTATVGHHTRPDSQTEGPGQGHWKPGRPFLPGKITIPCCMFFKGGLYACS